MKNTRKLKQLISQIKNAKADAEVMRMDLTNKKNELMSKQRTIDTIQAKIDTLHDDSIRISEHAMLRYLQRIKGIDIKEIEKEILTPEVHNMIETLGGNGKYPNGEFQLVMKNYVVTTIVN